MGACKAGLQLGEAWEQVMKTTEPSMVSTREEHGDICLAPRGSGGLARIRPGGSRANLEPLPPAFGIHCLKPKGLQFLMILGSFVSILFH